MLLKNLGPKYEKHKIYDYNQSHTKVIKRNVDIGHIYGNIYIGKPYIERNKKRYIIYLYFKECDAGIDIYNADKRTSKFISVFSRAESSQMYSVDEDTSVKEIVEQVERMNVSTAQGFMEYVDRCVLDFNDDCKVYRALVKAINPEREKLHKKIIDIKNTLSVIHKKEHSVVAENTQANLIKSFKVMKNAIHILKNGGVIVNEIICKDVTVNYGTVIGLLAEWYYVFLPPKIYDDIDTHLETVTITDGAVSDIKTSGKKKTIINTVNIIISKLIEENVVVKMNGKSLVLKRLNSHKEV